MYYVMTERESLVTFLPPGGVGAEIGVARGDFPRCCSTAPDRHDFT